MASIPSGPQYVGKLTPTAAAEGIERALANARALVDDARLLLDHQRWPRASALAILAIEEAGKTSILRMVLLEGDPRSEWKSYRKHTAKNVMWLYPQLVRDGARRLDDATVIHDASSNHPHFLEQAKQASLYTDARGHTPTWSSPAEVIDEAFARTVVAIAEVLVSSEGMTTAAELEIWVKHLRPVYKTSMREMKRALAAAYSEAHEFGVLKGSCSPKDMMEFLALDPEVS